MPAIRLDSRDLLEYNAKYRVLICRECRYAIQKSALTSHLLRHKIYRGERQRLLSSIAGYDLLEPEDVPLPIPSSPPIDALPVIGGYRCTSTGCASLCASSKRMRRHWSDIHGANDHPHEASSLAFPVKLQTFFRGTKIRYFEVASSLVTAPLVTTSSHDPNDNDQNDDTNGNDSEEARYNEERHVATSPPRPSTAPQNSPGSSPAGLDLETMTYFHHFITTTILTLPSFDDQRPTAQYWQNDVVPRALRRPWLMHGLLALSACHLALLTDDITLKQVHRERSAHFFSAFSSCRDETIKRDLDVVAFEDEEKANEAGRQLSCILCYAQWSLAGATLDRGALVEPVLPYDLLSMMTTVRSFITTGTGSRPSEVSSDKNASQDETFTQARNALATFNSSDPSPINKTPPALLDRLRTLPFRMSEAIGRPESPREVLTALSAIAVLVECCAISFASEDAGVAWLGMALWLAKIPDHFQHLVESRSPAALVVLFHWVAVLVRRAELCGCWFLRGAARRMLLQMTERFHKDDGTARRLVTDLMV